MTLASSGRASTDLVALLSVRRSPPHLHAGIPTEVGRAEDPGVLALVRRHPSGTFVGLFNVAPEPRSWAWWHLDEYGVRDATDARTGQPVSTGDDGHVWLEPYEVRWFVTDARLAAPPGG